jgi:peptidoglycan hydrolase-like protein with peptidoglycan-binding domain
MKHYGLILLLWSSCVVASAQEGGFSSFVDLIYTDTYSRPLEPLTQCTAAAPDPLTALECFHNMEIIDGAAFADCEADELGECGKRFAYPTPFFPESYGQQVEGVYEEIYDRFYSNVHKYAVQELGKCMAGGCYAGGACVADAVAKIFRHAYGSLNTVYWQEIFAASLYYLNTNLWYNLPFPDYGAVLMPIFSYEENPEQYNDYATWINDVDERTRGLPYAFTSPDFENDVVPYENTETEQGYPGLYDFELLKEDLETATLLEYQQFGFSTVLQFYGDNETMIVEPLPCVFALPLFNMRLAFAEPETVAEGYKIPNTEETPWVPLASPTSVTEASLTAFLTLDPSPPPVRSTKPLSEVLSCEPFTPEKLAEIDVLDTTTPGQTNVAALDATQIEALQYLLRDSILGRYGSEEEREEILALMGDTFLPEIEITGALDPSTTEALGYIQGKGNLDITGVLDADTLGFLASSNCQSTEGDSVLALQTALGGKGFNAGNSGVFDSATQAALTAFQQQAGLEADGNAGLSTWLALFSQ